MRSMLDESHMLIIAGIGKYDTTLQGQETDVLLRLKAVIMPNLVRQGRGNELGRLVQPLVRFLVLPALRRAVFCFTFVHNVL